MRRSRSISGKDWSSAKVRSALKGARVPISKVASTARVSPSTVKRVLAGSRHREVERAVASALGKRLGDVYPQRARADAVDAFSVGGRHADYEGATTGRRLSTWGLSGSGPNSAIWGSMREIRMRARQLVRNNSWASRGLDSLVANLVGYGVKPRWKIADRALKRKIHDLFDDFTETADADEQLDFYGMTALAMRGVVESGEMLARFRPRRLDDVDRDGVRLPVPLQIQLLEPEFFDDMNDGPQPNGLDRALGINLNEIGRRVSYQLFRQHPGDVISMSAMPPGAEPSVAVPAKDVAHLYKVVRGGQLRGLSWFAATIIRLYELDQYDDAELVRQKIAAMLVGFMHQGASDDAPWGSDEGEDDLGQSIVGLEPGTLQFTPPGVDKIEWSNPPQVAGTYPEFTRSQLQAVSAALGVTYEQLSQDLRGVTYSSIRAGLVEFRRLATMIQHHVVVHQFCRRVARQFMDAAILGGKLAIRDYATNSRAYLRVDWRPPPWDWVDPEKEVNTLMKLTRGGFQPRQDGVAALGYDVEEVDERYREDNERQDKFGLVFDSDPRWGKSGMALETSDGEPTESGADKRDKEEDEREEDEEREEEERRETRRRQRSA